MSKFPDNLRHLKRYFVATTGRDGSNFSVRGFVGAKRNDGYHLGRSDIFGPGGLGLKDYSIQRPRDRGPNLTDFASAIDLTLPRAEMKRVTAELEELGRAGLMDIMEFLGPGADGRAYWHDRRRGFRGVLLKDGNAHERHIHVSYPRKRIKDLDELVTEWLPIFGPAPSGPLPPDETDPEPPTEPVDPEDPDAIPSPDEELEACLARVSQLETGIREAAADLLSLIPSEA